jgi:hypothetical protein
MGCFQVFDLMMLSALPKNYQRLYSQTICIGLGLGIVFTPSMAAAGACLTNPATLAEAMVL